MNEQIPKVPRGETVSVRYHNRSGELIFLLTVNPIRDFYYLYEVLSDGTLKKLGKSQSPFDLEEKFEIKKRIYQ